MQFLNPCETQGHLNANILFLSPAIQFRYPVSILFELVKKATAKDHFQLIIHM